MFTVVVLVGMFYLGGVTQADMFGMNSEQKLFHDITESYDPAFLHVRPVANHSKTLTINFGLALVNINSFDEKTGEGRFLFWDRYTWKDSHLTWDPEHYDGISTLRMPMKFIWKPDIFTYNSMWKNAEEYVTEAMAVVSSDGTVLYIPPHIRHIRCSVTAKDGSGNKKKFICTFKIGSWTYDGFKLDLAFYGGEEKMDLTDFQQYSGLNVVANTAKKNVKYYPCCQEPYPDLTFKIEFEN